MSGQGVALVGGDSSETDGDAHSLRCSRIFRTNFGSEMS